MRDLIFVIYSEDDKEQAEKLYDDLAEKGVRPWMASRDLLPGQNWKHERAAALRRSKCVLVLLSSRTLDKRGYMQKEQKMALEIGDEFPEGDIFVVPVKLDDCHPKNERLAELVPVELFPDYDQGLAKILKVALLGPEEKPHRPPERPPRPRPTTGKKRAAPKFAMNAEKMVNPTQAERIERQNQIYFEGTADARAPMSPDRESIDDSEKKERPKARVRPGADGPAARILHLSDLHFGTPENAANWFSQLAEDLKGDLDCRELDALIVSGDIGSFSLPGEYEAATLFVQKIFDEFGVDPMRTVVVPGNHDLNRDISELECYVPKHRKLVEKQLREGEYIEATQGLVLVRDRDKYHLRFRHFSDFYRFVAGEPYPTDPEKQATICHVKKADLLILGLNSAWKLDHFRKKEASICPGAVSRALDLVRANPQWQRCRKIAVWHHPINSPFGDRVREAGFLERLAKAGFEIGLHGHMHKAKNELYRHAGPGGAKMEIVGAGTFGAPVKDWTPGFPLQYTIC